MDEAKALHALHLFSEKAERLEGLRFTKSIFSEPSGVRLHWEEDQDFQYERYGPDDEAIQAFCLTFRFFIQKSEVCSFQNLDTIYSFLLEMAFISPQQFGDFQKFRAGMADMEKPIRVLHLEVNGEPLTPWLILDTIIYADLSHANPKKRPSFELWRSLGPFYALVMNDFVLTLGLMMRAIRILRAINEPAIAAIVKAQAAKA